MSAKIMAVAQQQVWQPLRHGHQLLTRLSMLERCEKCAGHRGEYEALHRRLAAELEALLD